MIEIKGEQQSWSFSICPIPGGIAPSQRARRQDSSRVNESGYRFGST